LSLDEELMAQREWVSGGGEDGGGLGEGQWATLSCARPRLGEDVIRGDVVRGKREEQALGRTGSVSSDVE
jgi:hypothetical protein